VTIIETVTPEQAGMSANRLHALHAAMQAFVDDGQYAGLSTLIVRRGQVVDARCYGQIDRAANKPMQPDSLFRIYSLTKPITSVAALMLWEDGAYDLDDPVSNWIPNFANFKVSLNRGNVGPERAALERPITFRHLLTHTAGLGYGFMGGPLEDLYAGEKVLSPIITMQMPLPEIVKKLPSLPLIAQPGTIWSYSLSHDVLGYLIGRLSGRPFEVFLRERIFEPLGMSDSSFFVPPDKLDRFGPMYTHRDETGLSVVDEVAGSVFVSANVVPSGGAGLVSSMADYARFMTMLANGGELDGVRLLKPSTFAAMTTNQLPPTAYGEGGWNPGEGYGLGLAVREIAEPPPGHPAGAIGWGGASGTTAWVFPHQALVVVFMAQSFMYGSASDVYVKGALAALVN
jgi:CubicO group peptidase (beta-lactamase class C family)